MSSFEILERYNDYSTQLMDMDPKMRIKGLRNMLGLFYDAPELKVSIMSKLEQLAGDSDDTVAKLATRIMQQIKSGRQYRSYYSQYSRPAASTSSTGATGSRAVTPPQNVKSIVANVVCCVVFIIIYFVLTYVVF